MKVLRDASGVHALNAPDLLPLIEQRLHELATSYDMDPWEVVFFIVMEPGDAASALDIHLGRSVIGGIDIGDRIFHPAWELLEEHATCYEMVVVLGDDGAGADIFIPKVDGVDPDLLAMCSKYAMPGQLP